MTVTDREKIVFLAKTLGTYERSTLMYEYIAGRRLDFNQEGEVIQVKEKQGRDYWPVGERGKKSK